MNVFIQHINNKIDLIFPDTKNDIMAGTTDNTIIGKLIKTQNLVLDKTAFVFSQKKLLLNVKLISLFYLLLKCVNIHE
ncbi:hypothetical protein BTTOUR_17980 [Bacillus thuringiensis serovar toumanoffi]|uniref:Uncharacterized protein n=1 Tax=Bacillus thuringiensis serovar toumanoffi TaxID=180862 RepID=A0ABD5I0F2_BACTU|nr:hypothetical protein [Bacillus thuringiensis serovar toumanoffi]SEG25854.1 hypothetical protein SAMN04487919_10725 [Bacillus sp. ok061]